MRATGFVQVGAVHGLGVLAAQLENVADFDAATQRQRAFAVRAGVAFDGVAQVGDGGFGQVASKIDASQMKAVGIGTTDKIGHHGDGAVGDNGNAESDRADGARAAADHITQAGVAGEADFLTDNFGGLDFIELVIATQQQRNRAVRAIDDEGFDHLRGCELECGGNVIDAV